MKQKSAAIELWKPTNQTEEQKKMITGDFIGHLLIHNVFKSFCEDWKVNKRKISRFFCRRTYFWNWNDVENLSEKEEWRKSKYKIKQLSKHKKNQRQKKPDEDQRNAVQPSGVRRDFSIDAPSKKYKSLAFFNFTYCNCLVLIKLGWGQLTDIPD
jgi:adenine-specific DNA methylase